MTPDPENPQQGKAGDTSPEDAAAAKANVEETPEQPEATTPSDAEPQAEGTAAAETGIDKLAADVASTHDAVEASDEVDQQKRADEEAARAAAAAEEAAEAAEDGGETAQAAAAEAEELAEKAEEAAEAAAEQPKSKRSRKAREAEQAADQAEEAAEDAVDSAKRSRARRGKSDEGEKPSRRRGRKGEEPKAVPVGLKVSAQAKYVRTSARKARLVCDHIRGKDVEEARAILAFTPRGAAKPWLKLLESAVANAEHNHELVGEELRIFNVHADEGPTLKRYRPRAMGRATRIRKRTSHLSITLTPKES
jgi:large subunit ribosomal protein L22